MPINKPNYTQSPNIIFDEEMKSLSGADFKVIMCICRKTFGWQKKKDKISISQIMEMTGLGKTQVIKSTKYLEEKKLIKTKKRDRKTTEFTINISSESEQVKKELVQKVNKTGSESEQVKGKTSSESEHTKESIKETNKEKSLHVKIMDIIYNEYLLFNGDKLLIDGKEASQVKILVNKCLQTDKYNPLLPLNKKIKILKQRIKSDNNGYYSLTPSCLSSNWNKLTEKKDAYS